MKLTLTYEGRLPATQRGISSEKAGLRSQFHPQIKSQLAGRIEDDVLERITSPVGEHSFVSPAHPFLGIAVELDVLLLTPRRASPLGDLDNRLKTLIDGLTRPANSQQLQGHAEPKEGGPNYCLLDDDSRVQRIGLESRVWHLQRQPDYALAVVTATLVVSDDANGAITWGTIPLIY